MYIHFELRNVYTCTDFPNSEEKEKTHGRSKERKESKSSCRC